MSNDKGPMTQKIVCIEDEESMAELLVYIVQTNGFRGFAASNGQDGLDLIRREKPDLVLLDLMLPGIDGWEVYQQMKADSSMWTIPVIVVTCKARHTDEILARNIAKVNDYIPKPFSPSKLMDSIRNVLSNAEMVFQQ